MTPSREPVDLAILGAGSGGYAAALRAAELGMSVVMVERDKVGGTCLHRGCIPTKALLHAAEVADNAKEGPEKFGVKSTFDGIDMAGVNAYKDGVVSRLYKGLTGLVKSRGIEVVEGEGRLASPTSLQVGDRTIEARHVVLATGFGVEVAAGHHDRRRAGHHQRSRAGARPRAGVRHRARRRRDRLRVRVGLELLRRQCHHRRGAAPPRPGRGGVVLQAAGAPVPPQGHHVPRRHQADRRRRSRTTASPSPSRTARR